MKQFAVIAFSFLSLSCTGEHSYVYKDLSSEIEREQLGPVPTQLHAYLENTVIQGFQADDSDTVTPVFSTKASQSSLLLPTFGIQGGPKVADQVIRWKRVKTGDQEYRRAFTDKNSVPSCPKPGEHPWDQAYEQVICHHLFRSQSTKALQNSSPLLLAVEPEYGFYDKQYVDLAKARQAREQSSQDQTSHGPKTTIRDQQSPFWPSRPNAAWHLESKYSELSDARKRVSDYLDQNQGQNLRLVKAAHLDSGYFDADELRPKYLSTADSMTCLLNYNGKNGKRDNHPSCVRDSPNVLVEDRAARTEMSHGSRTLSVLAGSPVTLDAHNSPSSGIISAYPELRVASFRITRNSPVHFFPSEMAAGIVEATNSNYDVISLSQGGFPSIALREAINHAYENGTAIFAATGDFFSLPLGSVTPHTVAFPARFNRVMAVAGVTADHTNYADNPCIFCLWRFWDLGSWILRGSYGPASAMSGHSLSAYSPNIATSVSSTKNKNSIQLDGGGVSFAVPQVAGAAALWLTRHEKEFSEREWRSWIKVEAVYLALMNSANKDNKDILGYSCEYMGEGILRANLALEIDKKQALPADTNIANPTREPSTIGYRWVYDTVMTWDLVREGLLLLTGAEAIDNVLINSIREMAFTEIQQILHRSDRASALFAQIFEEPTKKACPDNKRLPQNVAPHLVQEFIEVILLEKNKSTFLTALMNRKLVTASR